jgi:hypothetical protein
MAIKTFLKVFMRVTFHGISPEVGHEILLIALIAD